MKKVILGIMFLCFSMVMFAGHTERPPTDLQGIEQSIDVKQNIVIDFNFEARNAPVINPLILEGIAVSTGGNLVQNSYTNKSTLFKNSIAGKYSYETKGISQLNAIHNIASTRFYQDNKAKRMNRPIVVYSTTNDNLFILNPKVDVETKTNCRLVRIRGHGNDTLNNNQETI